VSNLSVASFRTQHTDDPTQHTDDLVVEQITLINEQQQAAEQAARRARVRAISTWARLWGKRIQLFSSGMLVAALAAECAATGGQLQRAATRTTALSRHCLCGQRVPRRWRSAPITARLRAARQP
jgi:hypothetical protein